ncbi:MAG: hypothetical protein E6Q88_07370 [Lysobacteraceae bacterium]|nr:MAG: hypothetical protein E6Q88_07370 [Xanthomonadaceae bacterium]
MLGYPNAGRDMIRLDSARQTRCILLYPAASSPATGAWGRGGYTLTLLKVAPASATHVVLASTWRLIAPKRLLLRAASE